MGLPTLVLLNMADELHKQGVRIRFAGYSGVGALRFFGSAVVAIVAVELASLAFEMRHHREGVRHVQWLALPLIPFVLLFWSLVFYYLFRNVFHHADGEWAFPILGGVVVVFGLAFLLKGV